MSDRSEVTCVFLSHSKQDVKQAHLLRSQLIDAGYPAERVFIDDDPRFGLIPGSRWRDRLSKSLRRAVCLVVLSTKNWQASKWCHGEAMVADALGRTILPLDVDGLWEEGSYGDVQAVRNFDVGDPSSIERLVNALESLQLAAPSEFSLDSGWEILPFDDDTFSQAVWQARLRIFGTANLAASLAILVAVLTLLWFVIEPRLIERREIALHRQEYAVVASEHLSELSEGLSAEEAVVKLVEKEGDAANRLGVRIKLSKKEIQRINQGLRVDDVKASGFELVLFFADSRTWPTPPDELKEGWWLISGVVQDVNFSEPVDDADVGFRLQPVQQLSLEECVPFEKLKSPGGS